MSGPWQRRTRHGRPAPSLSTPTDGSPFSELTRRDLFKRSGYVIGAGMLPSWVLAACSAAEESTPTSTTSTPATGSTPPTAQGNEPFDTLREMQATIRTSPDHFIARAAALVAAGDPEAIIRFVTDDLRTLPTYATQFNDGVNLVRWGHRAALRCGAGTPRELADLTVDLLTKAGVTARVVSAEAADLPGASQDVLSLRRGPDNEIAATDEQLAAWRARTGARPRTPQDAAPAGAEAAAARDVDAEADALAADLLDLLGDRIEPSSVDFAVQRLPVVEVDLPSGTRIAVPALPGSPLLDPESLDLGGTSDAEGEWQVTATLAAARSGDPDTFADLVTGSWTASDLIGNQLQVQLLPGVTFEEAAITSIGSVRTFAPSLLVRGVSLDLERATSLSFVGDAVDVSGARVSAGDESGDGVIVDGIELVPPGGTAAGDPEDVTDVEVEVDARAFPELLVHVTPRDSAGRIVPGLQPEHLSIIDEGTIVPALMTSNQESPRIALLVDQSQSMPEEYRGGGSEQLLSNLQTLVESRFPAAVVNLFRTDSDIWKWLGIALAQRPDLVVYVTDGDQDGGVADEDIARLRTSGPTVFLDVEGLDPSRFDDFVAVTGAAVAPVGSAAEVLDALATQLDTFTVAPYRFSVRASSMEPDRRTLDAEVRNGTGPAIATGTTTYDVPAASDRLLPEAMCSLRLRIELARSGDGRYSVERILAGRDPYLEEPVSAEDIAHVRDAIWGVHLVHVEGGGIPVSLRADEWITGQLGLEPLFGALGSDEPIIPRLEEADRPVPAELYGLVGTVVDPQDRALVFEHGLRMVRMSVVPRIGTDRFDRLIDILPTALFHGADDDPRVSFEATLRATSHLAQLEAATFARSTASVLADRELVVTDDPRALGLDYGPEWTLWRRLLSSNSVVAAPVRIAPMGGGKDVACWSVSARSGEVLGLLDGSGGTDMATYIEEATAEFDAIMDLYAELFGMIGIVGPGGFALSVIAEYSKTLVKLYAAVSFVLINLDAAGLDDTIKLQLLSMVCNVARDAFLSTVFGGMKNGDFYEELVGVITTLYDEIDAPLIFGARCPS